jgi:uncharacterized protein (UPF0218 family)
VARNVDAAAVRKSAKILITVGDACSYDFTRQGVVPDVAIYDYKEERMPVPAEVRRALGSLPLARLSLGNPAGTIQAAAWKVIGEALVEGGKIEVDGEEDLLALPCIALAPMGSVVVYGQPGQGAVIVNVDANAKKRAEKLLSGFEAEADE